MNQWRIFIKEYMKHHCITYKKAVVESKEEYQKIKSSITPKRKEKLYKSKKVSKNGKQIRKYVCIIEGPVILKIMN
jgi:hypothetical protein